MNHVEEAKEHFEAAIRIMPTHLEVGPEPFPVAPQLDRVDSYHFLSLKLRAAHVHYRPVLTQAAFICWARRHLMAAMQAQYLCNEAGSFLQALFNLANLQRQCGEFEAAVRSYERVLELSPDSWLGLRNYSVALVGLGRELEAKQALRRAVHLSGESAQPSASTADP